MIILITVISFIMDGVLSKYIPINSLFLPLFTIVSMVIVYPYFNNNNYRYFKYIAILGLLYDIVYMNTVFYNFFLFMILGFLIALIFFLLSNNIYTNLLITFIVIVFLRLINYFFLIIFLNKKIFIFSLYKSIYSSLLLNIFYCIIIYIITEKISKKYKIIKSK